MRVNVYEIRGNAIYVIIIQTFMSQMCQNVNGYHNHKPQKSDTFFFLPCITIRNSAGKMYLINLSDFTFPTSSVRCLQQVFIAAKGDSKSDGILANTCLEHSTGKTFTLFHLG